MAEASVLTQGISGPHFEKDNITFGRVGVSVRRVARRVKRLIV